MRANHRCAVVIRQSMNATACACLSHVRIIKRSYHYININI